MKTMHTKQTYTHKAGKSVSYEYDYPVFDTLDDAKANGGRVGDLNRQVKIDASNVARAQAVTDAGLAPERTVSPERKSWNSEYNKAIRDLGKLYKVGATSDAIADA